jgi:hypothetical protein
MTSKLSIKERDDIIHHILTSEEFKDQIRNDPQFIFNYNNVSLKINEYAIENKLWEDEIGLRTLMKCLSLPWLGEALNVLADKDPLDMRWQKKRRHEIIEDIMARDDFRKHLPVSGISKKDIFIMVNDYAIKHGLWKEGISISTLRNDFTFLYGV